LENYYDILGVSETATQEEIKKAFRTKSKELHPDRGGDEEQFKKVNEAYSTLSDEGKKQEYDMTRNNPFFKMMGSGAGRPPGAGSNPMDEIFSNIFGMHFGPGNPFGPGGNPFGPGGNPFGPGGNPFGPGGNPFGQEQDQGQQPNTPFGPNIRVFHNGMPINIPGFSQGIQRPTPIIKTILVPIDKILTGTTIPVEIERWLVVDNSKVFENETVYISVPKGIDEGEIIILREKGNIIREDCKGDIKIFINI
jgi:DnaJ-class molecular chaperone